MWVVGPLYATIVLVALSSLATGTLAKVCSKSIGVRHTNGIVRHTSMSVHHIK